ncbi:MAG: hypothetical protein ACU837_02045 [Gammaproteobacteria bacterium]
MKIRFLKPLCCFAVVMVLGFGSFPVAAQKSAGVTKSAGGKYENLIQVLPCPADKAKYGEFNDYGYWAGGPWCGQMGRSGYWVWLSPKWYIWEKQRGR